MQDLRCRNQAAGRSERAKADHLLSSQGPLSSIRAVIKRTRTNSQSDHNTERRRPEITILSAEPLAGNTWFPGSSGVFPPPHPPSQPSWSGTNPPASQPPPSYDQVIKEKTQEEHISKPTAAPRRSACTTTSATQTDPVREDATAATTGQQCSASPDLTQTRVLSKKPKKPPRPLLPKRSESDSTTGASAPTDGQVATSSPAASNPANQSDSKANVEQPIPPNSPQTWTRSVTVHWDFPTECLAKPCSAPVDPLHTPAEIPPLSSDSAPTERPTPLPRSKTRKQPTAEEVGVQILVGLGENGDCIQGTSCTDHEEVFSNQYLRDLLEVFGADNHCKQSCNSADQSDSGEEQSEDAGGEMSTSHSQCNIQARIQAFESQASTNEGTSVEPTKRPEPRPRNAQNKPPTATKPSLAPKPSFNRSLENDNSDVSSSNVPPNPAPRPQPPKKPVDLPGKEPDSLPTEVAVLPPSWPSILARTKTFEPQGEDTSVGPPTSPVKPSKELFKPSLNHNNHNSTSMVKENVYVPSPTHHTPFKPQCGEDSGRGSFKQSVTRRPTTIRVPCKPGILSDNSLDGPPPLPTQKPVGSFTPTVSNRQILTPVLPPQESVNIRPEMSLPPRPSGGKVLPPRPPPAKTGPGRPPPPRLDAAGRSPSTQASSCGASPKLQTHSKSQMPQRKGPVLPPRPNPGHRLYNKYTFELPHGIAALDYNGSNIGELSFQKNEVLLLLGEIDNKTFECQVGDSRGRVQKSNMKVITPLSASATSSPCVSCPPTASPAGSGRHKRGLKVQALHDFTPEGPGELGLKAGDVVNMVEQVDSDWYKGTCRGSSGFFPTNYVKVLSKSPMPTNERKTKPAPTIVSGPRCVARFDYEGELSDELSFSEGDVIVLREYIGQEWARGTVGVSTGIFPLNFVEVIEDLPPPPTQQQTQCFKIALPGMVGSPGTPPEATKHAQAPQSGVQWLVALYDFNGQTKSDLSFKQGDHIMVTQHIDAEWCSGRLNNRTGIFPKSFVESYTGHSSTVDSQLNGAPGAGRAKALFDFTSDCEEELSLQVGDIITNLESIDEEWFLGDLRGKRALVPKNYVQVLGLY
ncbi:SH3 domain-containing protein 19 [Lampris incognitus]|uniref:SH3 domain-containing protein 19 n=1 Tax=Lampris incognitus TaxID=2546036 RepID=UPI0024B581A2|nr:SH3 domain-containing protein 19 [Lampris incognitus]